MKKRATRPVSVGIRKLKNELSRVLARVRSGQVITVTDRKRAVALLVPVGGDTTADLLPELIRAGRLSWNGGKPAGTLRPPLVRGPSVSEAVIEDRR